MAEPATELTFDSAALLAAEEHEVAIVGRSPWYLAWRRLRRNYVALFSLLIFLAIVISCALAPVYAHHIAHTGPNQTHVAEKVNVGGELKPVIGGGAVYNAKTGNFTVEPVTILGPTWWHAGGKFVLGSDNLGRDVAVRLLYGGLNSLKIGIGSALICTFIAVVLALIAGYFGGWIDWIVTRGFDLIWAFPVLLLAIALGSALSVNGFHHFGINIGQGSLWIPTLVISVILIPYVGRPLRGQILSLRQKEFVEAAVGQGAGPIRIMFSDLLPNVDLDRARLLHADHRRQHPHRGRPLVPRSRSAAARSVVGEPGLERPGSDRDSAVAHARSRDRHRADSALAEHLRRRPPRRPRPARQGEDRALTGGDR